MSKNNRVNMKLDTDFFNMFEKGRESTRKKLGLSKLSQRKFSKMIAKNKMELFEIC